MGRPARRGDAMGQQFSSFAEFYPVYLGEHRSRANRRLHFAALVAATLTLAAAAVTLTWWLAVVAPAVGYLISWVGHFGFERNTPATFQHPLYSFLGDLAMFKDMLTGKIEF